MNSIFSFFILFFLYFSQGASVETNIDEYLHKCYNNKQFNGNVLVAKDGEIIFHKSFGLSNINPTDTLNLTSQFRLASLSKTFTAMAIIILKERNLLKYEDKLTKFIPDLPYHGITIRHLLTHTSGIPKYEDLCEAYWDKEQEEFTKKRYVTNKDIIQLLIKYNPKVLFEHGSKYAYSNTGYVLLASIVENVTGVPFEVFMKENIFKPLEMNQTLVYSALRNDSMDNRVHGYKLHINGKDFIPNDFHYMSGIAGDGAMYSTTGDLYKWDRALYSDILVPKESIEDAFSPATLNNGDVTRYGLGWGIGKSLSGKKTVSHGGGWIASRTYLLREIEENNTVIILTNHTSRHIYDIRYNLTKILHEGDYESPKLGIAEVLGKSIEEEGIEEAISEYKKLKKLHYEEYDFDKWELNYLGYKLLEIDNNSAAIEVFKLNVEEYPDFPRAYNDLADTYSSLGKSSLAIKIYEQTLEVDPKNWYAKGKLKKLKPE